MSKLLSKRVVIVPTDLGALAVTTEIITDFDIEDVIARKAESQALLVQMSNVGKDTRAQTFDSNVLPSKYINATEELDDGSI